MREDCEVKTTPVWRVEYVLMLAGKWTPHVATFRDLGEAQTAAKLRENEPQRYACVRVTGPFDHQVPE